MEALNSNGKDVRAVHKLCKALLGVGVRVGVGGGRICICVTHVKKKIYMWYQDVKQPQNTLYKLQKP